VHAQEATALEAAAPEGEWLAPPSDAPPPALVARGAAKSATKKKGGVVHARDVGFKPVRSPIARPGECWTMH
jgi:hypothetical protein